jgi:hypothetical protein
VIANGLRELDRFLSILLDEVARSAGWATMDLDEIARMRNTSTKLGIVNERSGARIDGCDRLLALSRCRALLFHCDGVVRRGDRRGVPSLTLGWPCNMQEGAAVILQQGDHLIVGARQLAWIGAFYEQLGTLLLALPASGPPAPQSARTQSALLDGRVRDSAVE